MTTPRSTMRPASRRRGIRGTTLRARAGAAAIAATLAVTAAAIAPAAAHAQRYRVYQWDTPMQGWAEPALWDSWVARSDLDYAHFGRDVREQGVTAHSAELEYGMTDRFTLAGYADFESAPGLPLRYTAARLEGRYRFGSRYQRFLDPALYLEYSVPRAKYEASQELEARLILQRDLNDFRLVLNPIVGRTFSGTRDASAASGGAAGSAEHGGGSEMVGTENAGSRLSGGFAGGLYWRRHHLAQPGVEYYNQVGPLGELLAVRDQRHAVVPTVDLRFIPGLDWNLGVVVGLTPGSDRYTLKSVLSYEFQTIRPANRAP